jgi:hypothetical protein
MVSPEIMYAEKANANPSTHRASASLWSARYGTRGLSPVAIPVNAVNTTPARGSVPYVVASPRVLALAS